MKSIVRMTRLVLTGVLALLLFAGVFSAFRVSVRAEGSDIDIAMAEAPDDIIYEEEEPAETGKQGDSTTVYTTPAEAFDNLVQKFTGFFTGIAGFFQMLQTNYGTGVMILVIACISAVYLFFLFSLAICFKKAGVKPWLAFIPFVAVYYCYKIGWEGAKTFRLLLFLALILVMGYLADIRELPIGNGWEVPSIINTLFGAAMIVGYIYVFIAMIRLSQGWAEGYGVNFVFGIGLWLLPVVFVPILAFGRFNYVYTLGTGEVRIA